MRFEDLTDDQRVDLAVRLISGMSREADLRRVIWNAEFHLEHGPMKIAEPEGWTAEEIWRGMTISKLDPRLPSFMQRHVKRDGWPIANQSGEPR